MRPCSPHREHNSIPPKSIRLLNKAVTDELAAVHQYMCFHYDDQGYDLLAALFKRQCRQLSNNILKSLKYQLRFSPGDTSVNKHAATKLTACEVEKASVI